MSYVTKSLLTQVYKEFTVVSQLNSWAVLLFDPLSEWELLVCTH